MTDNTTVDPGQNALYRYAEDLPRIWWSELAGLDPQDVCLRSGAEYSPGQGFSLSFLGRDYLIRPDRMRIETDDASWRVDFQTGLVLIQYLRQASSLGLAGRFVSARELNGGALFFQGPHALTTEPVVRRYGQDGAGMLDAAKALGAEPLQFGDAAFRLLALPRVAASYVLYEQDDEFPADLNITLDAFIDRHLPLDCIWAMINLVSYRLAGR